MTILGLNCLLENLMDEKPHLTNKQVESLSFEKQKRHNYLAIKFKDGSVEYVKLYETNE